MPASQVFLADTSFFFSDFSGPTGPRCSFWRGGSIPDSLIELQSTCDGMQRIGLLERYATSVASAALNASADLTAADDFETTYLQL